MGTVHASGTVLFAQVGALMRLDIWLPVVALLVVVGLGLWIIWRWRTGFAQEAHVPLEQQIEHYREMVTQGQLDPEEFARIKAQLERQPSADPGKPPDDHQPPDTSIRAM
jgi:ABC-type nickel/cobalt efflux system permease component RcnA